MRRSLGRSWFFLLWFWFGVGNRQAMLFTLEILRARRICVQPSTSFHRFVFPPGHRIIGTHPFLVFNAGELLIQRATQDSVHRELPVEHRLNCKRCSIALDSAPEYPTSSHNWAWPASHWAAAQIHAWQIRQLFTPRRNRNDVEYSQKASSDFRHDWLSFESCL